MKSRLQDSQSFHSYRSLFTQSGFTLVEIMIVVTTIGIVSSVAIISYQTQLRQIQVMTIYQEINHFRMPYQILIDDGAGVTAFSPSGLNMPDQTKYCRFTVITPDVSGLTTNAVTCNIQNLAYIQGETLSLDRAADGSWQCRASVGISKNYLTKDCQ